MVISNWVPRFLLKGPHKGEKHDGRRYGELLRKTRRPHPPAHRDDRLQDCVNCVIVDPRRKQDCYKVRTYLTTYHNIFGPINGKDLWTSSGNAILLPPDVKRRAGRPKKLMRREPEEEGPTEPTKLSRKGVKMTCSFVGKQDITREDARRDQMRGRVQQE